MTAEMKKVTLRLNENMYGWFKNEAEEIGIPMHSLIVLALLQYQRQETILPNLPEMIKALVDVSVKADGEIGKEQ